MGAGRGRGAWEGAGGGTREFLKRETLVVWTGAHVGARDRPVSMGKRGGVGDGGSETWPRGLGARRGLAVATGTVA